MSAVYLNVHQRNAPERWDADLRIAVVANEVSHPLVRLKQEHGAQWGTAGATVDPGALAVLATADPKLDVGARRYELDGTVRAALAQLLLRCSPKQ